MDNKDNNENINPPGGRGGERARGESPFHSKHYRGTSPLSSKEITGEESSAKIHIEEEGLSEIEINFRNVIKNPLRWFGFIYFYFIALLVAGGIFYVNNIERIHRNDIAPVLTDSTNIFADIKPVKGSISQAVDVTKIMNPTDDMKSRGKELYDVNCASCHGANGQGDGIAGAALNPKPRNFHATDGWLNGREFLGMFKTLQQGIPTSAMPAYSHLPVQDRIDMITYVRTFAQFPPVTDNDITQLNNQYNLAKGDTTSSQISVSSAIQKVSAEALPSVQNVYTKISTMNNNKQDAGYQILDKVSSDKVRVISFLSSSGEWKSNINSFVKTVVTSTGINGFKNNVSKLSSEEWNELHQYLVRLFA